MQLLAKLSATTLFLQECVTAPRRTGALLPSSQKLAVAMARYLPEDSTSYALELGPGTGSVTHALLERGLRQDRLIAIEQSPKMAELLRKRYPRATIITGDAFQLDKLLKQHARHANIGVVVSSLPLKNFAPATANELAKKIRAVLPADGRLVQYSYHIWNKKPRAASHLRQVGSDVIWLNLPPARVTVYEK